MDPNQPLFRAQIAVGQINGLSHRCPNGVGTTVTLTGHGNNSVTAGTTQ